jgi:hypothetical protein
VFWVVFLAASIALRRQLAQKSRRISALLVEQKDSAPEVFMVAPETLGIAAEFLTVNIASSLS